MSSLILILTFGFQAFAQTDFSVSVELDEPTEISSTLSSKGKSCIGMNQKTEIKHPTKVCDRILREYKTVFDKAPN